MRKNNVKKDRNKRKLSAKKKQIEEKPQNTELAKLKDLHGLRKYILREPNSDISTRIKGENNAILKAREEDQTS